MATREVIKLPTSDMVVMVTAPLLSLLTFNLSALAQLFSLQILLTSERWNPLHLSWIILHSNSVLSPTTAWSHDGLTALRSHFKCSRRILKIQIVNALYIVGTNVFKQFNDFTDVANVSEISKIYSSKHGYSRLFHHCSMCPSLKQSLL